MDGIGLFVYAPLVLSFCLTFLVTYGLSPVVWNNVLSQDKMKKLGSKRGHLNTLLASSLHGIIAVVFNGYSLSTGELSENTVTSTSYLGLIGMYITLGYCIADFITSLLDKHLRGDIGMLLHHLAMVAGIGMGLYHGLFNFFIVYRFISEFSTPWVNLWWAAHNTGMGGRKWYIFSSLMMVLTFSMCRVFVIPWHTYLLQVALFSPSGLQVVWYLRLYMFFNYTVFDLLNAYWFFKMLKGAYKVFCTKKIRAS